MIIKEKYQVKRKSTRRNVAFHLGWNWKCQASLAKSELELLVHSAFDTLLPLRSVAFLEKRVYSLPCWPRPQSRCWSSHYNKLLLGPTSVQSSYQSHLSQMELLDKFLNLFLSAAINENWCFLIVFLLWLARWVAVLKFYQPNPISY